MPSLNELSVGERARVVSLKGDPVKMSRFLEIGLVPESEVQLVGTLSFGRSAIIGSENGKYGFRTEDLNDIEVEILPKPREAFNQTSGSLSPFKLPQNHTA